MDSIGKEGLINYFLQQLNELEELERNGLALPQQTWDRKQFLKKTIQNITYDWEHNPHLFKNKE